MLRVLSDPPPLGRVVVNTVLFVVDLVLAGVRRGLVPAAVGLGLLLLLARRGAAGLQRMAAWLRGLFLRPPRPVAQVCWPGGDPAIHDVLVVGAGPAGLSAALHLRKLGLTVQVLERSNSTMDKVWQGMVSLWRSLLHRDHHPGDHATHALTAIPFRATELLYHPGAPLPAIPLPSGTILLAGRCAETC